MLLAAGICPELVVEPQDEAAYRTRWPDVPITVLAANDGGLYSARQSTLALARERGQEWYWMLDDDVDELGTVQNRRVHPGDPAAVLAAAELGAMPKVGGVALQYRQVAWKCRKPYGYNRSMDVCVLIHTTTGVDYDSAMGSKCDRDFALQHIMGGWPTVVCNWLTFDTIYHMAQPGGHGGCAEMYAKNADAFDARRMVAKWPGVVALVEKRGRVDAKVDWRLVDTFVEARNDQP